jgi:hypothetical protein
MDWQDFGHDARTRPGRVRRIAATIAAGAVLMGSGVAIGVALTGGASAATGGASTAASAAAQQAGHRCARLVAALEESGQPAAARRLHALCDSPLLRLAAAGIHGEVTYKAKGGFRTLAFERGTVESAGPSAVTVQAADGTTWTWDIVPSTVVRQDGKKVAAGTLAKGDQVLVAGPVVAGVNDARLIRIRTAG